MSSTTRPTFGLPAETRGDSRFVRVFGSRRALIPFATIVFVATAIQVLVNPIVALLGVTAVWDYPLPLFAVSVIVTLICALQSAALLLSVRSPWLAVLGTLVCYLAMIFLLNLPGWVQGMEFVVAIAMFLLAARGPTPVAIAWLALVTVVVLTSLAVWAALAGAPAGVISAFVLNRGAAFFAPAAGATALGIWWGVRSRRVARAYAQIEEAERDQEERIEVARAQERVRIAQELHDVASQHIAGLLSLADAAIDTDIRDLARAVQLIEDMRVEGRFASASLYAALRDLRSVDGRRADRTPDLRDVPELLAYWQQRGMTLEYTTLGELSDLPAVVSTSAYRGVQEALTNAAKHALGATVRVAITTDDERLRISVENGRPLGERSEMEGVGLGWGLDGLRERVSLLAGTVDAGATPGGGWRVTIDLPLLDIDTPRALVG
ncbi:sensor histidine kinase [uncultured Microbacterium sp.]|uniref:sensor histidine kinase n=1 Tax=uncultured Microbacterium sp. TaxID=191216 RepID=UPI0035CB8FE4